MRQNGLQLHLQGDLAESGITMQGRILGVADMCYSSGSALLIRLLTPLRQGRIEEESGVEQPSIELEALRRRLPDVVVS